MLNNKFRLIEKVKIRLWDITVNLLIKTKFYYFIYKSYWYYIFHKSPKSHGINCYFTARPNPGAGIGHQMANWIAGFWYAEQFGLKFAHIPFSREKWEEILGLGIQEAKVTELVNKGYIIRKIPKFDEYNNSELNIVKAIIQSYSKHKVVFMAEQDQIYAAQIGVKDTLYKKYISSPLRKTDKLIYNKNNFNIALHVRRTVITGDGKSSLEDEKAKSLRWLSNDYYKKVLDQVLDNIVTDKIIDIYIYSTGDKKEFLEFSKYRNIIFCDEMDEYESFIHLVNADLLITSKSSFSYKPALINIGIKICPRNFWHSYPTGPQWILADNDGTFDTLILKENGKSSNNS